MSWGLCHTFTFLFFACLLDTFQDHSPVLELGAEQVAMVLGLLATGGPAALGGEVSFSEYVRWWRFATPLCQLCFSYATFP